MPVEPVFLAWTDVSHPAVSQLFGGVVEPQVLAIGQRVVVDRGLNEVAGDIALVIAAMLRRPPFRPAAPVSQRIGGLQISIRLLSCQDDGDPFFQSRFHLFLSGDNIGIALRVHHERNAHGFDRLVNPGIGEDVTLVTLMRLAAQGLRGLNKVIEAALSLGQVGALALGSTVGNPAYDQRFGALVPKRVIDGVPRGVDHVQPLFGRAWLGLDDEGGGGIFLVPHRRQLQNVFPGLRKRSCGIRHRGVGKGDPSGARLLAPAHAILRAVHQPVGFSCQPGFATEHHRPINACIHRGRKERHRTRAVDLPLQDAWRKLSIRGQFEPQPGSCHLIKGRAVELVGRRSLTLRIRNRNIL